MRKERIYILFVSAIIIALFSFKPSQKNEVDEDRNLPAFTKISISISAKVYITQGDKQKVSINASDKQLKIIETKVKNGKLKIKCDSWGNCRLKNVVINITVPKIDAISVAGSSDVYAEKTVKCDELMFAISGSGSINFDDLSANDISSSISGSGDIILKGNNEAKSMKIHISGSGSYTSKTINSDIVEASISGSGTCNIRAKSKIKALVSGSGDVYYYGKPVINARVSGSGSVKNMD